MYKDGKPDHEAPQHSAYKQELKAIADAALKSESTASPNAIPSFALASSDAPSGQIAGLDTDIFGGQANMDAQNDLLGSTKPAEPLPQAMFQPVEVQTTTSTASSAAAPIKQLNQKGGMQMVSTSGSGMSFARKQDNGTVKAMGAKKLDIDFGSDDFFNSF